MLSGALTWRVERGHRSLPIGVEAVPLFCALYSAEKPHVFRKATKEVAFQNTCGFWARIVI